MLKNQITELLNIEYPIIQHKTTRTLCHYDPARAQDWLKRNRQKT